MPNRIEHITDNGIEKKWCWKCKSYKPVSNFGKLKRQWDGLNHYCKDCSRERLNDPEWCARDVYRNMLKRIKEKDNYIRKGVKCKVSFDEFKEWYTERHFPGCILDRIDNNGHYEIGNIQLLTRTEHNHKLRKDNLASLGIIEADDIRHCHKCGKVKHVGEFYQKKSKINKYNPLGLDVTCKDCTRAKRRERYKEHKP